MKNNHRSIAITSLVFTTLLLVTATASITPALGSTISVSGFNVTPTQAPKGAGVTATITVQNLDTRNPVTVTVAYYDGGAPVGSSSPTVIRKGGTANIQFSFATLAAAPHCYTASATPGPVNVGYCESGGHLLGGIGIPAESLALVATTVALASIATAGMLWALLRRRTI